MWFCYVNYKYSWWIWGCMRMRYANLKLLGDHTCNFKWSSMRRYVMLAYLNFYLIKNVEDIVIFTLVGRGTVVGDYINSKKTTFFVTMLWSLPSVFQITSLYSETLNNENIERIHQMSYSAHSDNVMLLIFSFLIKWLYGTL